MDLGTPDEPKAYIWLAIVCLSLQRHTHRTPRPPRQDGRVWCRDAPLTDPVCVPLARPSPSGSRPGSLHNGSCPPEQSRRDDLRSATPSLPHTSPVSSVPWRLPNGVHPHFRGLLYSWGIHASDRHTYGANARSIWEEHGGMGTLVLD